MNSITETRKPVPGRPVKPAGNMISFDRFNRMPIDEKAWYIWNDATFLMARESDRYRFNLFFMSSYYVELVYSFKDNDISRIRAFSSEMFLKDYLREIDLGPIGS